LDWHYGQELVAAHMAEDDLFVLIRDKRYGRVASLRQLLIQINLGGRLANVIYAMGLTQTDFYPHQFKPLLTLLDSPVNGLLIADEVGLGKTIEAGLIWTELRAREDLRRLLVVCPAMLRVKWKMELSTRFGLDAQIVDAETLGNELASDDQRERAWIVSYQGIRVPTEWDKNNESAHRQSPRVKLANILSQHSELEPLIDLVIFDEAHYMRNSGTSTWQTGSLLREVSKRQLMLSATPINLGSGDLFNVLSLLDPDHFEYSDDFKNIIEANRPIIAASDIVRNPNTSNQQVIDAIREIESFKWFSKSERLDNLIIEASAIKDWTNEARIEIAAKLERLNLLAHVVTRTRKREVHIERAIRDASIIEAVMSTIERELYQAITQGTREYAKSRGMTHGFLLSMPQRMVASSPTALLQTWQENGLDPDALAANQSESDDEDNNFEGNTLKLKTWLAKDVLSRFSVAELRSNDSKFAMFYDNIKKFIAEDRDAKAIVFTTYRGTAKYLVDRLTESDIKAALLMGGAEFDKETVVDRFRTDVHCKVLICTDVAAEGVDLQFCHLVVNYDLPWNPMRVEQRIGRIDRIGQLSKRILIWNFVFKDTIDARILSKLTSRIGIFESTLGETEEILGQVRKLEDILLSRNLTAEEESQLIDEAAIAIENIRRQQEVLEREAVQLVAHGQHILAQIETARGDGNIINRRDLIHFVDLYLRSEPGCRMSASHSDADTFEISLSPTLAASLDLFIRKENMIGKTILSMGHSRRCRFTEKITEKAKQGEEIIHRFHPLIRFISQKIAKSEYKFPLYAVKTHTEGVNPGIYLLMTRLASFGGIKDEDHLLSAVASLSTNNILADRACELILNSIRTTGIDWPTAGVDIQTETAISATETVEDVLRDRYKSLRNMKDREYRDRAQLLLQIIDDHIVKKSAVFNQKINNHDAHAAELGDTIPGKRRKGLANAERKKLADFLAHMSTRKAVLLQKSQGFSATVRDVCTLVIEVLPPRG
jgi:SNF2 family DNA or RNA helicase